jgi:hypothetical protein
MGFPGSSKVVTTVENTTVKRPPIVPLKKGGKRNTLKVGKPLDVGFIENVN